MSNIQNFNKNKNPRALYHKYVVFRIWEGLLMFGLGLTDVELNAHVFRLKIDRLKKLFKGLVTTSLVISALIFVIMAIKNCFRVYSSSALNSRVNVLRKRTGEFIPTVCVCVPTRSK